MTPSPLTIERAGPVLTLIMDRPTTRNALSRELVLELGRALNQVREDAETRAVILTGRGEAFCSGADLKSAMTDPGDIDMSRRIDEFHAIIRGIVHCDKPVVAAVDGGAVGFGADLALACDLRVLSSRAYIQEKFVKIGLMPDGGGTFWMPRLVGIGRALEHLMLGTKIDAELALSLGLANRVVPADDLSESALSLASELAKGPPLAFAAIKRAVRENFGGTVDAALDREKQGQLALLSSQDMMEGVMAWAQRREPSFKGQ